MAIGVRFATWGLGLFIFGVFLTFGIIAHYCVGLAGRPESCSCRTSACGGHAPGHCP